MEEEEEFRYSKEVVEVGFDHSSRNELVEEVRSSPQLHLLQLLRLICRVDVELRTRRNLARGKLEIDKLR